MPDRVTLKLRSYCISLLSQDLLALLKNVESEIASTEINLKDEVEKRKKFRVRNFFLEINEHKNR